MAENFNFNAPQFMDFTSKNTEPEVKEIVEAYFEIDHEDEGCISSPCVEDGEHEVDNFSTPIGPMHGISNTYYYIQDDVCQATRMDNIPLLEGHNNAENISKSRRESRSMKGKNNNDHMARRASSVPRCTSNPKENVGELLSNDPSPPNELAQKADIADTLHSAMENLQLAPNAAPSRVVNKKKLVRSNSARRYCTASQESINKLSQNKVNPPNKFISMAESIRKLQNSTPERFKTKPKAYHKPTRTIPQSPALSTRGRSRPLECLNHEQQEEIVVNQMKKYKIKAIPLDPKVLAGPSNVTLASKPPTLFKPFNLTEAKPKKPEPINKVLQFHANPLPKVFKVPPTNYRPRSAPKQKVNQPMKAPSLPKPFNRTIPKPFSFESRDKDVLKKKEETIQQIFMEEKKRREFHARPMPSLYVAQLGSTASSVKSARSKESVNQEVPRFKAKPAKVLQLPPFQVKKEERMLVADEFELNTERRAKEREEFNQKVRENEAQLEEERRRMEAVRLLREEEEILRLRKVCAYKAQPIKVFKPIEPPASKQLTNPVSPKLGVRKLENKENINFN